MGRRETVEDEHCRKDSAMNTAKDEVRAILDKLPDDCSLEDVQYHLYVVRKIQRGIEQAENGETLTQAEMKRKFAEWISK